MKAILIFSLICFTFSIWGPAEKAARPGIPCESREIAVESLSDCVDRYLYHSTKKKYFDRCCFVRGQFYGRQEKVCTALTEEEYLDIVETKKKKKKKLLMHLELTCLNMKQAPKDTIQKFINLIVLLPLLNSSLLPLYFWL